MTEKKETGQRVTLFGCHDGFSPFGDDGVSFVHGHPGIFGEHRRSPASPPCHETDEVLFAQRGGSARRICRNRAAFNQTPFVAHRGLILSKRMSEIVCRTTRWACKGLSEHLFPRPGKEPG